MANAGNALYRSGWLFHPLVQMSRKAFHLGRLLATSYLVLSSFWVLVEFDNPWHQAVFMVVDFPASYLVFGIEAILSHVLAANSVVQNILTDFCFVLIGTVWFFVLGTVLQRAAVSIFRKLSRREN